MLELIHLDFDEFTKANHKYSTKLSERRTFGEEENRLSLEEAGLCPQALV